MNVFKYTVTQAENQENLSRRQIESGWTMTIILNYNRSTALELVKKKKKKKKEIRALKLIL